MCGCDYERSKTVQHFVAVSETPFLQDLHCPLAKFDFQKSFGNII